MGPAGRQFGDEGVKQGGMIEPSLRGARVAVVGLGRENVPVARFLVNEGAQVTGFDRKERGEFELRAAELERLGVRLHLGSDYLQHLAEERYDLLVLTPGMVKDQSEIRAAVLGGARVAGQMNLFFDVCRAPIVGVTGTSGKSTTTSLIGRILAEQAERPVYVGGNIGHVLIEEVRSIPAHAWVVLELSSFQLELLDRSPHLAVFLNVRPNHLDVHGSMEAYVSAKANILRHQESEDRAVFNADDPTVRMLTAATGAELGWFSATGQRGPALARALLSATEEDGWLVVRRGDTAARVMLADEVPLPGRHNLSNVLAAVAAASLLDVPPTVIRRAVCSFRPLEHRLEPVVERDGVRFVNDSIATTPDRTVASLTSFDGPVVLIAGGYDKGIPYEELGDAAVRHRLRALVLMGQTSTKIEAAIASAAARLGEAPPPFLWVDGLEQAVVEAWRVARRGDVVLLSPASASYGMFADFEERGRHFKQAVARLTDDPAGRASP